MEWVFIGFLWIISGILILMLLALWEFTLPNLVRSARVCFYRTRLGKVMDYSIRWAVPPQDNVKFEKPLLSLDIEYPVGQRRVLGRLEDQEPEEVLASMGMPRQLAVAWFSKEQWDDLLVGKDITLAAHRKHPRVVTVADRNLKRLFYGFFAIGGMAQLAVLPYVGFFF